LDADARMFAAELLDDLRRQALCGDVGLRISARRARKSVEHRKLAQHRSGPLIAQHTFGLDVSILLKLETDVASLHDVAGVTRAPLAEYALLRGGMDGLQVVGDDLLILRRQDIERLWQLHALASSETGSRTLRNGRWCD